MNFSLLLIPILIHVVQSKNLESIEPLAPKHKKYTTQEALFHGNIMTSCCCCILQIMVLMQRHLKAFRYTSFIHGFLGICISILILYSFYNFYEEFNVPDSFILERGRIHIRLGFTICTLMTMQVFLGILTKFLILYKKSMYLLLLTRKVHHLLGWIIAVGGFVNVHIGWKINHYHTVQSYIYPAYGVLGFIYVVTELFRRKKVHRTHSVKNRNEVESEQNSELMSTLMTYSEYLKEIRSKGKKWVFYNDFVLDLSHFSYSHPGGSYLIEGIIGEDSAKYLYGISNYSREIPANQHSSYALKLTKDFAFNKVFIPDYIICSRTDNPVPLKTPWKVLQRVQLSSTMTIIELYSSDLLIKPIFGYEWMGFHFLVKHNSLKRFYSLVVVNLAKWSSEVKQLNLPVHLAEYRNSVQSEETLRLYVKTYKKGNVSKYLSGLDKGDEVLLKGPYGPGLGITRLPKGPCLAFAAGTGVLVFLDLVYAIWNGVRDEFRLSLYVSFNSREEAIGLDLLEATQKRFRDKLKLQINLDKEKIGVRLTNDNVKPWITEDLKLAWVCGPASFNRFIQEVLLNYGVNKSKIMIL